MKTVPFSDILAGVCQLAGLDRVTLNDKSFAAIRDFSSRRLSVIWDREEWPDLNRFFSTWPGLPVSDVSIIPVDLITESDEPILAENDEVILAETAENVIDAVIQFDLTFRRIYLQDFAEDRFKKGTIGESYVSFFNPFYLTLEDGTKQAINSKQYQFTYTTLTDDIGEYIETIKISVPFSSESYSTYTGPNSPLTTKVVFEKNKQLLIQLPSNALQGLGVWNQDPRKTTRAVPVSFLVEDFTDQDMLTSEDEVNYLRIDTSDERAVQYRIPPTRLTGYGYDELVTYSRNAQVYFDAGQLNGLYNPTKKGMPSIGNFFTASDNVPTGVTPANQTQDYWQIVEIPARFRDYMCNSVTADFLKSEGRAEEAMVFEQLAETAIQQQIDVLIRQQGQVQRLNMVYTY